LKLDNRKENPMRVVPEDISQDAATAEQLYTYLDRIRTYRQAYGAGQTAEATQARWYCNEEKKRLQAELKARKLPLRRPGSGKVWGPGRIEQRAHTGA
jgi:hypothetical protein